MCDNYNAEWAILQCAWDELRTRLPPQTSHLKRWFDNRCRKYAAQSLIQALDTPATAEQMCDFLDIRNRGRFTFAVAADEVDQWAGYWADPCSMWDDILQGFQVRAGADEEICSLCDLRCELDQFDDFFALSVRERIEYLNQYSEELRLEWTWKTIELHRALVEAYEFAATREREEEYKLPRRFELAVSFFADVWFPCIDVIHKPPQELYGRAMAGSVESLESMLRIDRHARMLPVVREAFLRPDSWEVGKVFQQAMSTPRNVNSRPAHIKALLSGWVIEMSRMFGLANQNIPRKKFSNTDMRKLFDAHVRDHTGQLRDCSLPAGESAWNEQVNVCRRNFSVENLQVF